MSDPALNSLTVQESQHSSPLSNHASAAAAATKIHHQQQHDSGGGRTMVGFGHRRPPKAASQLVDMLHVKEPVGDIMASMLTTSAAPVAAQLSPLEVYDSSADPFLRQYWQRKTQLPQLWRQQRSHKKQTKGQVRRAHAAAGHPTTPMPPGSEIEHGDDVPRAATACDASPSGKPLGTTSPRRVTDESTHDRSSSGGHDRDRTAVVFHEAAINRTPVDSMELVALRTLMCPTGNWISNLRTPHCDLNWFRRMIETKKPPQAPSMAASALLSHGISSLGEGGETTSQGGSIRGRSPNSNTVSSSASRSSSVGSREALVRSYHQHATKTLASLNFDLLAHDATRYNEDNNFNATLLNSPRSVLILLRCGLQAYELLKRPVGFYLKIGEEYNRDIIGGRAHRAEANRVALVQGLQEQYRLTCERISADVVDTVVLAGDFAGQQSSTTALVAQRLREKSDATFDKLQRRMQSLVDLEIDRRQRASEKAIAMSTSLVERNEKRRQQMAEKAQQLSEKVAQRMRTQQMLNEVLMEDLALQASRIEEKHERVAERYEGLKEQRRERGMVLRETNEGRSMRSRSLLRERDEEIRKRRAMKEEHQQERAEEFRQRMKQERDEASKRSEETAEKQQRFKSRAAEHQLRTRQIIEQRLEAAETRLAEFREKQEEDAAIRSILHQQREAQLRQTVEAARMLEEERAQKAAERQQATERRFLDAKQREQQRLDDLAEQHTAERETKLHIVDAVRKRNDFDSLVDLSRMQMRDRQVTAFEQSKQDAAKAAADARMRLRIMHHELVDKGEADRIEVERRQEVKIYSIEHPPAQFPVTIHRFAEIEPRIDAGPRRRRRSPTSPTSDRRVRSSPRRDSSAEPSPDSGRKSSVSSRKSSVSSRGHATPAPRGGDDSRKASSSISDVDHATPAPQRGGGDNSRKASSSISDGGRPDTRIVATADDGAKPLRAQSASPEAVAEEETRATPSAAAPSQADKPPTAEPAVVAPTVSPTVTQPPPNATVSAASLQSSSPRKRIDDRTPLSSTPPSSGRTTPRSARSVTPLPVMQPSYSGLRNSTSVLSPTAKSASAQRDDGPTLTMVPLVPARRPLQDTPSQSSQETPPPVSPFRAGFKGSPMGSKKAIVAKSGPLKATTNNNNNGSPPAHPTHSRLASRGDKKKSGSGVAGSPNASNPPGDAKSPSRGRVGVKPPTRGGEEQSATRPSPKKHNAGRDGKGPSASSSPPRRRQKTDDYDDDFEDDESDEAKNNIATRGGNKGVQQKGGQTNTLPQKGSAPSARRPDDDVYDSDDFVE